MIVAVVIVVLGIMTAVAYKFRNVVNESPKTITQTQI